MVDCTVTKNVSFHSPKKKERKTTFKLLLNNYHNTMAFLKKECDSN